MTFSVPRGQLQSSGFHFKWKTNFTQIASNNPISQLKQDFLSLTKRGVGDFFVLKDFLGDTNCFKPMLFSFFFLVENRPIANPHPPLLSGDYTNFNFFKPCILFYCSAWVRYVMKILNPAPREISLKQHSTTVLNFGFSYFENTY